MYGVLLMAGFNAPTVRSSDKSGSKIEAVRRFSDAGLCGQHQHHEYRSKSTLGLLQGHYRQLGF